MKKFIKEHYHIPVSGVYIWIILSGPEELKRIVWFLLLLESFVFVAATAGYTALKDETIKRIKKSEEVTKEWKTVKLGTKIGRALAIITGFVAISQAWWVSGIAYTFTAWLAFAMQTEFRKLLKEKEII
jgi:hypothetical protein